mgnify:CR=1 FL=1
MKQVEKNNFSVVVEDEGKDELNYLTQRFNKMVNRTGELIDQKISMETEKKDAELRVLEEQINPHFLYNTLDMINWIAFERNDVKNMSYYRNPFLSSTGRGLTPGNGYTPSDKRSHM